MWTIYLSKVNIWKLGDNFIFLALTTSATTVHVKCLTISIKFDSLMKSKQKMMKCQILSL